MSANRTQRERRSVSDALRDSGFTAAQIRRAIAAQDEPTAGDVAAGWLSAVILAVVIIFTIVPGAAAHVIGWLQ